MSLFEKLLSLEAEKKSIRVALIGAGKFATMYLAQIPKTPGIEIAAIIDINVDNVIKKLNKIGWDHNSIDLTDLDNALKSKKTFITDEWEKVIKNQQIDIVIEATGDPIQSVEHVLKSFEYNKHVVMVTVEADAYCGPYLSRVAKSKNLIYSLAYGDQPALICDLIDWARTAGFKIVSAGRGHKWLPHFRESTPETVWKYYGLSDKEAKMGGLNPKMFNSFLDGSKPSIESTSVCNASGLIAPKNGLTYPPSSIDQIPNLMRPETDGGILTQRGQVEVISSIDSNGDEIEYDIRFGVWVVFEGDTDYIKRCFNEYGVKTDTTGKYACMYKRWHLIGLEVGLSVASIALRSEPTGCPRVFNADVIATAKKNLSVGEILDGEGGFTVVGQITTSENSLKLKAVPLGLASGLKIKKNKKIGEVLTWNDIEVDKSLIAYMSRKEMEKLF